MSAKSRREFMKWCGAAGAGAAVLPWAGCVKKGPHKGHPYSARPNIIFFMIDDCSTHEFGCYGAEGNPTPNIDRLAAEGIRFKTAWTTPLCMPTRMLVNSGMYAHKTGSYDNGLVDWDKNEAARERVTMLGKAMQHRGYATVQAGKWHLPEPPTTDFWGFDESWCYASLGPKPTPEQIERYDGKWWKWHNANELSDTPKKWHSPMATWHPLIYHNGEMIDTGPEDFGPEMLYNGVTDFIRRQKQNARPFYAYYAEHLTHTPWTEMRDPETGGKTKPGIVENVKYTDHLIGRLAAFLKAQGLWENTVLIIGADNPTQGLGKACPSAVGAHVPLIVTGGAAHVRWRGVTDCLMDYADLYPTFVDLAGGSPADYPELDGRSFKPLLDGHRDYSKPWMFSYLGLYRSIRNREYYLDGAGRMWRCHPSGNPFEFEQIPREKESPAARKARRELESVLEGIPAPLYMVRNNPQALESYEKNRAGEICGRMQFADRIYQAGVKKLKANPERLTYHTN